MLRRMRLVQGLIILTQNFGTQAHHSKDNGKHSLINGKHSCTRTYRTARAHRRTWNNGMSSEVQCMVRHLAFHSDRFGAFKGGKDC